MTQLIFFFVTEQQAAELCDVHYASLNFRDVMLATGKLSIDSIPGHFVDFDTLVGSEFSGVDSSGKRVMGMVPVNVRFFIDFVQLLFLSK